jgi:hypothetical protein
MAVTISLERPDVDELRSLRNWLAEEPTVRRFGQVGWVESSSPAEMGNALDALSLGITAGLSVAQLATSLVAWRESRPRRNSTIVIEYRDVRVRLDGSDEAQLGRAIDLLSASIDRADAVRPES